MSTFGAILRNKSAADVLVQFDKATLVIRTTDTNYLRQTRSLKMRDLRVINGVGMNGYLIDARVSDDELNIEAQDGENWWPLHYLGPTSVENLRVLANVEKLSVSAADLLRRGEEAFIQLAPGDGEQLLVYLDELEEQGRLR